MGYIHIIIIIIIIIIINERHSNIIVLRINFKVAATAKAVGKVSNAADTYIHTYIYFGQSP